MPLIVTMMVPAQIDALIGACEGLASLNYQKSRLVRSWTHLERQRGGFGFLGGPGETQIEIDRRLIGDRIRHRGQAPAHPGPGLISLLTTPSICIGTDI